MSKAFCVKFVPIYKLNFKLMHSIQKIIITYYILHPEKIHSTSYKKISYPVRNSKR
jgi:hypothetical protein